MDVYGRYTKFTDGVDTEQSPPSDSKEVANIIHAETLSLIFGEKVVLDAFSLTIPETGVTALSGPSGCGKTSFLRCLAGLQTPNSGTIHGISPSETAILFQENRLLPWRTVKEHIVDVLPHHQHEKADFFLSLVQLEEEANSYPGQLSGGMGRRLALARCLALDAKLYLLDEPFTGIDLPRIHLLMNYLRSLPVPVLLSTHEPEVLTLAHRVIPLDGPPLRQK